jgi:PAS domain S-box-containing protein
MEAKTLENIINCIESAMVIIDKNNTIIFGNDYFKSIFNYYQSGRINANAILPVKNLHIAFDKGDLPKKQVWDIDDKKMLVSFKLLPGKNLLVYFQSINDIEEYSETLYSLKELNKDLEAIFDASFDEIYVTDGQGITTKVSKKGESFYGVKSSEMIGKNTIDLEKEGLFSPSVTKMVLERKTRVTTHQKTKSGKQLIVTGNPVFDEYGNIIRVVINSRDISELVTLRQQLKDTEVLANKYFKEMMLLQKEKVANESIITESEAMKEVLSLVQKVSKVDSTVLISGESGVGKGIIASLIHNTGNRQDKPFISINCGAIPETLLESELFGYEKGAFTGARNDGKKGLLELANNGTILLDEISEIPLNLQVKLLQAIQEKQIMRIGGQKKISLDFRIIAATNRDMKQLVQEGKFREDLFYRLNVIPIHIPPLRERKKDIEPLILNFMNTYNEKYSINKQISEKALELLANYSWPGNVREVENLIERLIVTSETNRIGINELPDYILKKNNIFFTNINVNGICSLKDAIEELERQLFCNAYESYQNTYKIAEKLEINQSTVVRKLAKYIDSSKRNTRNKK